MDFSSKSQPADSHLLLLASAALGRRKLLRYKFVRLACRQPLGAASAVVLGGMVLAAVFASWITPYDPVRPNPVVRLSGPSLEHLMGTDHIGRDVFSRIIYGTRPSLYTGLIVVSITGSVGLVVGVSSAFLGGIYDLLVQRVVDALTALPGLILAMSLISIFSSGIHIGVWRVPVVWHSIPLLVAATLSVLLIPSSSRVTRSAAFAIVAMPYVEAAQAMGCSKTRIMVRHVMPNVMAPLLIICSAQLGAVILIEASLSFLGLGLPPPHPSWGGMLQAEGRNYMTVAPWLAVFPGLAITVAVLAFNLLGDGLRDELDPRMRGG